MISLSNEVEQVVQDTTRNRRLFTAHDVTRLLRHKLDGENIRHNEVKRLVHEMHDNDDMGIYTRTQVNLGTRVSPFVYHLNHQDPTVDYDKDWVDNKIQASSTTTIDPMTGNVIDADDDDDDDTSSPTRAQAVGRAIRTPNATTITHGTQVVPMTGQVRHAASNANDGFRTRFVTKDKRLQVPAKMLASFNGVAHVRVDLVKKSGQNVDALILTSSPIGSNDVTTYNINSDGRLRISSKFLSRIGGQDRFAVKSTNGSVVIVAE